MSDELADEWHVAVCRALEARVKNRDFFMWVTASPGDGATPPDEVADEDWQAVADDVESWLEGIHVDSADPNDPPRHEAAVATTGIELTATPKKPNRRGTDPLVLNLYPGMTYFTGSHSAGPAPELPEDDSPEPPEEAPEPAEEAPEPREDG